MSGVVQKCLRFVMWSF